MKKIFLLSIISIWIQLPSFAMKNLPEVGDIIKQNSLSDNELSPSLMPQEIYGLMIYFTDDIPAKISLLSLSKAIRNLISIVFREPDKYVYAEACKVIWQGYSSQKSENFSEKAESYFVTNMYFPELLRDLRKSQYKKMIADPKFILQYCNQNLFFTEANDPQLDSSNFTIYEALRLCSTRKKFKISQNDEESVHNIVIISPCQSISENSSRNDVKVIIFTDYIDPQMFVLTSLFKQYKNICRLIFAQNTFSTLLDYAYFSAFYHLCANTQNIKSCIIQDSEGELLENFYRDDEDLIKPSSYPLSIDMHKLYVRAKNGGIHWRSLFLYYNLERFLSNKKQLADFIKKNFFINDVMQRDEYEPCTVLDNFYNIYNDATTSYMLLNHSEKMSCFLRERGALFYEETVISSGKIEWIKKIDENGGRHKNSLLHRAVMKKFKLRYVEQLLKIQGIAINARNDDQHTALDCANSLLKKNPYDNEISAMIKLFRHYKMKQKSVFSEFRSTERSTFSILESDKV